METNIDYKQLYELHIIEKEKLLATNKKQQAIINKLYEDLKSCNVDNNSKKCIVVSSR